MENTVTQLPIGQAQQAFRRLQPLAQRCRVDNEKFIVAFHVEWHALPHGEREEFAKLWGWSYSYCTNISSTGKNYPAKKQAILNILPEGKLPTTIKGMEAIASAPTATLKTMTRAGLFQSKTPTGPEVRRAIHKGIVPGLKKLKPKTEVEKLELSLRGAAASVCAAAGELVRARDLMREAGLTEARGPAVKELNRQFKALCRAMGDVQGVDYELLEG